MGNQAIDGGFLILSSEEKKSIVNSSPEAANFIRPLYSAKDFINGTPRFVIWIKDEEYELAIQIPEF